MLSFSFKHIDIQGARVLNGGGWTIPETYQKPVCQVLEDVGGLCCLFSIMQQHESKFYFP